MHTLLILAYPLCVHMAVTLDSPDLQLLSLVLLATGLGYRGIMEKSLFSIGITLVVLCVAVALSFLNLTLYVLYIPPVIIPLLFWSVFYRSLLPGQVPLVTDIGERVHGPFCDDMRRYTRKVTMMWSVFFILLAVWSVLLPWLASPEVWSLFTNFLNYLLIAALFIAEFVYRKWRFGEYDHPDFWQYLNIVFKAEIRKF